MKRTPHIRGLFPVLLALSVSSAILLALTSATSAQAAVMPRWAVSADSGAAPPPPPPAPAPVDTAKAPAALSAPAPADTARTPAVAPAAVDTARTPAVAPAPADTVQAPPPAPAPAPTPPPPPPLTKKQLRAQEKAKAREAKAAAKAPKHPKKGKKVDVDPLAAWNKGQNWVTLRAGFAKSSETGAAPGAGGAALGLQHFLTARWALGLVAQGDLLGKFGGAAEIEYPITLELTRHFRWKTALRPYLGAGGGAYYHKYFRTGIDRAKWTSGGYLAGGANTPIGKRSVLGLDGRMAFLDGLASVHDPVFGAEGAQLTHLSLKLGWSLAF